MDLSYIQGPVHGSLVAAQLIDVSVRAESVREYAVHCMLGLLLDSNLFMGQSQTTISNVLYAAGWIVGEYADNLAKHAGEVSRLLEHSISQISWVWGSTRDLVGFGAVHFHPVLIVIRRCVTVIKTGEWRWVGHGGG